MPTPIPAPTRSPSTSPARACRPSRPSPSAADLRPGGHRRLHAAGVQPQHAGRWRQRRPADRVEAGPERPSARGLSHHRATAPCGGLAINRFGIGIDVLRSRQTTGPGQLHRHRRRRHARPRQRRRRASDCGMRPNNTIGGTAPRRRQRHLRQRRRRRAASPARRTTTGNVVQGNFIGTDVTGTAALGNDGSGVVHRRSAPTATPSAATTAGARNVISGNGARHRHRRRDPAPAPSGNVVQGNFIGTDVTGDGRAWATASAASRSGKAPTTPSAARPPGAATSSRATRGFQFRPRGNRCPPRQSGRRRRHRHGQPGPGQPHRHRRLGDPALPNRVACAFAGGAPSIT